MLPPSFPACRPQEQLLVDLVPELQRQALAGGRILCNTVGRGQFAWSVAQALPEATVVCFFLDLYQQRQAAEELPALANLQLVCQTDPPADEVALAAFAFSKQGDAELTRELLQAGCDRLAIGGRLVATTDNPADTWLHERMAELFLKVSRRPAPTGVVYLATKTKPLRKLKDYACEFAFRDGERIIHLRTRPGVFSHRSLDGGARALIQAMHVQPGMLVLDLGCGSGAVAIAAGARMPEARITAIDSNPRAVESVLWGAKRNSLANITAQLDCDGRSLPENSYDLVLANPPYYSNFRLAELFVSISQHRLKRGGRLQMVTKTPEWYLEHLPPRFHPIESIATKSYVVVSGQLATTER